MCIWGLWGSCMQLCETLMNLLKRCCLQKKERNNCLEEVFSLYSFLPSADFLSHGWEEQAPGSACPPSPVLAGGVGRVGWGEPSSWGRTSGSSGHHGVSELEPRGEDASFLLWNLRILPGMILLWCTFSSMKVRNRLVLMFHSYNFFFLSCMVYYLIPFISLLELKKELFLKFKFTLFPYLVNLFKTKWNVLIPWEETTQKTKNQNISINFNPRVIVYLLCCSVLQANLF